MPNDLITQWLTARQNGDRMAMRRIETEAAEYDRHNPFGPRLADEISGLRTPAAA
ncbi:hypothetical protein [Streptomyces sp. NPDC086182]|jgi:hypothetical protein|uniref:hypothetical protein n=1 Tax=Streptomyces sp. NPDC086182 TaxID=3155058 RepID=UPI003424BA11